MKIAIVSALTCAALAAVARPNPTGTRPTQLTNVVVAATGSNTMQCSGRLTDLSGVGLAGQPIKVYEVGVGYITTLGTTWTANNGTWTWVGFKNNSGTKVQIDAALGGQYSQPFPTFNRP